jgi:hypothetical protein
VMPTVRPPQSLTQPIKNILYVSITHSCKICINNHHTC